MKLTRKKKTFHADKQKSEEVKQLRLEYQLIMRAIETNRLVGKQKQCIEATSHLFLHFNPYLNKHTFIEIN